MTEQELDHIMRRVLIDSVKMDAERVEKGQGPSFTPTSRYKRQMRAMLANPIRWMHRQEHPRWQQIARRAAIILLTCIVAFGGIMAFSPAARAAVVRWVMERYGNNIGYVYTGEQNTDMLPQYEITELPDGYAEKSRDTAPGLAAVTYENQNGDVLYLVYNFMHQGSQTDIILNEDNVFDISVNKMNGYFIDSRDSGTLNSITWIDEDQNIHFNLDGNFGMKELLHIAESVSLCKITK